VAVTCRRHRRLCASHAVGCTAKSYLYRPSRPIGLGISHHGLPVSSGPPWSSPGTVPRLLQDRFILPRAFLRFRELAASTCLPPVSFWHLPRGFFPLRDLNQKSPLATRFPFRVLVPPSVFLTLSTVSSSSGLAGLFHPTATCRICLTGAFPATQPTKLFAPPFFLPSCCFCALSYTAASRNAPDPAPPASGVSSE